MIYSKLKIINIKVKSSLTTLQIHADDVRKLRLLFFLRRYSTFLVSAYKPKNAKVCTGIILPTSIRFLSNSFK